MATEIDFHVASEDERIQLYRNVHDVWGRGLSLDEHLKKRLNSVQHQRAKWFVGCSDDRVITSLGAYPLQFAFRGESIPGFAIGAVHTLEEFRGQGLAPKLIDYVEKQESDQGAKISMLYSDIKPEYYAQLGYILCPAKEGWRDVGASIGVTSEENSDTPAYKPSELVPISPIESIETLSRLYDMYHARFPISIARNQEYWQHLLLKFPDDLFYLLKSTDDQQAGYLRLSVKKNSLIIRDYSLAIQSHDLEKHFFQQTMRLAQQFDVEEIGGWLPETEITRQFFSFRDRAMEITMLKSLSHDITLDQGILKAAEWFHEIDHV